MYKSTYYKTRRFNSLVFLIIVSVSFVGGIFLTNLFFPSQTIAEVSSSATSQEDSILWRINQGLPGTGATMQPRMVNLTETGEQRIIVGMDKGIAAISLNGFLEMSYITFNEVFDFICIDDISGDGLKDIVLITFDQDTYNVITVTSNNGTELWKFKPTIEGFDNDNYQRIDYVTHTWDVVKINDIDGDGISDIVISSWYHIIALDGYDGSVIKFNDQLFSNDVWKLEVIEDINGNGYETIIAGSQDGILKAFDSKTFSPLWTYKVEDTIYSIPDYMGGSQKKRFKNAVDDIKKLGDINTDNFDDIMIGSDDGKLRIISGQYGNLIDEIKCCSIGNSSSNSVFYSEYYDSTRRFFKNSGVTIYEIIDLKDDKKKDYLSIGWDLGFGNTGKYEALIFSLNLGSSITFNISHKLNWSTNEFYGFSRPEILTNSEGESSLYFFGKERFPSTIYLRKVNLEPLPFSHSEDLYSNGFSDTGPSNRKSYILNIGDINGNGVDDIFAISVDGRYLCLDGESDEFLWMKVNTDGDTIITEITDLNNDGFNDYLIKQFSDFTPDWFGNQEIYDANQQMVNNLYVLDAQKGSLVWSLKLPSPNYYKGVRDLKNVGDINGDMHDEYTGWIIPLRLPNEVKVKLDALTGEDYDHDIPINIYRALLYQYSKFIVINGSNGEIIWNWRLIDFPYKFYRQFSYNGSYLNPQENNYNGEYFYNRLDGKIHSNWTNGNDIKWNWHWNPSTLLNPSEISIEAGQVNTTTNTIDDFFFDDHTYYNISSIFENSVHKILMNITVPLDFTDSELLGVIPYNLSTYQRLSALKLQTSLLANISSEFFNFTYEIYDFTEDKWVICDWNVSETYWNNISYQDLKGGYDTINRQSYNKFSGFVGSNTSKSLESDSMWVITRGTKDADYYVEFDYENKTTLSNFITNKNALNIRLNITNQYNSFNLSIDSFGAAAFYWGLFDGLRYDSTYLWDFSEDRFTEENILDMTIQDFEIINATGDEFLDVIAVVGNENEWSAMISVFDIYNQNVSTNWDIDNIYLPNRDINILALNHSKDDFWLLTGAYTNRTTERSIHRLINNSKWGISNSHFENYIRNYDFLEYKWQIIPNFNTTYTTIYYEFPGKIIYTTDGQLGLLLGEYKYISTKYYKPMLKNFKIIDIKNKSLISIIPVLSLRNELQGFCDMGDINFEFDSEIPFQILPSYHDFNADDYMDHVGIYINFPDTTSFEDHDYSSKDIVSVLKIFSGNTTTSQPLFTKSLKRFADSYLRRPNLRRSAELEIPADIISDQNGDGLSEILIGIQSKDTYCDYCDLKCYDVSNGGQEPALWNWTLQEESCRVNIEYRESILETEFFSEVKNLGDINNDNTSEFFFRRTDYNGHNTYQSVAERFVELVDIVQKKVLYQFYSDLNSILKIPDLNSDNKNELLVWNDNTLLCVNSKFNIEILNIDEGQQVSSNFYIKLNSNLQYDSLEVYVNDHKYTSAKGEHLLLSLGAGLRKIDVRIYDESGFVTAICSISVLVNSPHIQLITSIIFTALIAIGGYVYYRRTKREKSLATNKAGIKKEGFPLTSSSPSPKIDYDIWTEDLTKIYRDGKESVEAVSKVNLRIKPGVHGYLGPNGAGKTTTLNMLIGAVSVTEGEARIRGIDAGTVEAKRMIGFLPQDPVLYESMDGEEYLTYMGQLGGLSSSQATSKAYELLDYFDLLDVKHRRIGTYSGGMKQKIAIASALIHEPKLLILDEPTANLDPIGRAEVISKIKGLSARMSVFVSSHILSEIEQMCDEVTMINKGKLILSDTITNIKRRYVTNLFILDTDNNETVIDNLREKDFIETIKINKTDNRIHLTSTDPEKVKEAVSSTILSNKIQLHKFDQPEMSLQDIFMEIMSTEEVK